MVPGIDGHTAGRFVASLWARFRQLPRWVQVAAWLLAWPVTAAVWLVAERRPGGARTATVALLLLVATPV